MMGAVGAAALPTGPALAARSARLPHPDPALWHIETPPAAVGTVAGPNGTIRYRLYGSGAATPVIALHGGPVAGERYMRPYAALASDRRVVLYDQSGCGVTGAAADLSRYTLARYVAELEAVRATLGFARVVLVGHSWGGILAPAYAATHPDRVAALVLAGTATRWREFGEAADRWLATLGPAAAATARTGKTGEPAYDRLLGDYYARFVCRLDPWPAFLAEAGEALGRNPVYAYLNGPSEFQFTGAFADLDMRAALRGVRVPTLITCGEYDEAPPFIGARIRALVAGSTLLPFAGLSHMAHIEDPARVVGATAAFLRAHG